MYSDAPKSSQYAVSELLYRVILSVWARMMSCDTECRSVDNNIVEAVESECALFIVSSCVLSIVLHQLFSTLVGVLASVEFRGNTDYVLMDFTVLSLLTISSNTGPLSESEE